MNPSEDTNQRTLGDLIKDVARSKAAVGLYGTGVLALGALVLGLSPMSPAGLAFGDVMLGMGQTQMAVQIFDAVAAQNPDPSLRTQSLRRSSSVLALHMGDGDEVRKRLFALAQSELEVAEIAAVHAEIGALFDEQHKPRQSARYYLKAYEIDPNGDLAAKRLRRAAEILQMEGLDKKAIQAWTDLAEAHHDYRSRADVGRAQIRLAQGDEQRALGWFEDAASVSGQDSALNSGNVHVAALARLGAATCLERLGNLDEALAALDEADLPKDVLETRAIEISHRADRWEGARVDGTK